MLQEPHHTSSAPYQDLQKCTLQNPKKLSISLSRDSMFYISWVLILRTADSGGLIFHMAFKPHDTFNSEIPSLIQLKICKMTNILVIEEINLSPAWGFPNFQRPFHTTSATPLARHRIVPIFGKTALRQTSGAPFALVVRHHHWKSCQGYLPKGHSARVCRSDSYDCGWDQNVEKSCKRSTLMAL